MALKLSLRDAAVSPVAIVRNLPDSYVLFLSVLCVLCVPLSPLRRPLFLCHLAYMLITRSCLRLRIMLSVRLTCVLIASLMVIISVVLLVCLLATRRALKLLRL